ncbi:hypothetical protein ACFLT8_05285, partial [Chloroflexota bacterium]
PESQPTENALVMVLREAIVTIPMESMIDLEAERKRLEEEVEQVQAEVTRLEARLGDKTFLERAPVVVVDRERQKFYDLIAKLEKLKEQFSK